MLLSGGVSVSDGGGDPAASMLSVLPIVLSTIAIVFTAITLVFNTRKSARDALWSYLQVLVSSETARSRSTVGEAARVEQPKAAARIVKLSQWKRGQFSTLTYPELPAWEAELERYMDAIFQMMWVVSLAAPALGSHSGVVRLVVGRSTALYRAQVYEHLNLIMPDLYTAVELWGAGFDSGDSRDLVDAALDAIPSCQKYGKDKCVELVGFRFDDLPNVAIGRVVPKRSEADGGAS